MMYCFAAHEGYFETRAKVTLERLEQIQFRYESCKVAGTVQFM